MNNIHAPNVFHTARATGTLCGLSFGDDTAWTITDDVVITDWEEISEVDCGECLQMLYLCDHRHLRTVPHPQPSQPRVHELASAAGQPSSHDTLALLRTVGHAPKAPASKVWLEGFERQALLAVLTRGTGEDN